MKRRDWLKAAAAGMPGALVAGVARQGVQDEPSPWRFELDGQLRWTLFQRTAGAVLANATIRVDLAGGVSFPLADLEGVRRFGSGPRSQRVWTAVGRHDGLEVSATFDDGPPPRITVRVRGLDEPRALEALHFTDSVRVSQASAWINGFQSWSPCAVIPVAGSTDATSHWQIALLGGAGLALVFGELDDGAGVLRLQGRALDAASLFAGRAVGAEHAPATSTLVLLPTPDPLKALGELAAGAVPRQPVLAAGWRSWHAHYEGVTEAAVLAALEFSRSRLDPRALRVIQLDDGYQLAAGDWRTNTRFPHGHAWLSQQIRSAGFEAALWMAPFAVAATSSPATEHPEWLIQGPDGTPLQVDNQPHWGGRVYALDASQREVQDWLRALARNAVEEWGYNRLTFDHLHHGAAGGRRARGASPSEALRGGLRALREGAGQAVVVGAGAPLQHALGRVDALRTSLPLRANWDGIRAAARGTLLRSHLNGRAWASDPGPLLLGDTMAPGEARIWAAILALTGGVVMSSDPLGALGPDRLELLQRALPAAPLQGHALDLSAPREGRDDPPSWLLAAVSEERWMIAAINWQDAPRRLTTSLNEHDVRGPLAAYDVWTGERRPDVSGSLSLTVEPHDCVVLGLRRNRRAPFVLGSSRHIVQGVIDVGHEAWSATDRTLSGGTMLLDGRPYALTIAVPSGMRPREFSASVECAMSDTARAVRLEFAPTRDDIEWQVAF